MKRCSHVLCGCAMVLAACPALARDWTRFATLAPADADILIIIEQASTLRSEPIGQSVSSLLAELIPMTATLHAWSSLAARLELSPDKAFDVLLGNHVVFIGRRMEAGPMQWAIESEIPAKRAYRVLSKLGARPRDIKKNHAVALLENNRFMLTYRRHGKGSTMIFAPTHSETLFNDLIEQGNRGGGASLADTPDFIHAAQSSQREASIFSYVRGWDDVAPWLGVTATFDGFGINIEFSAAPDDPTLWIQAPIALRQWEHFSRGALLAFVDRLSFNPFSLPSMLSGFGLGDFVKLLPDSSRRRIALAVFSPEPGRLSATAALETNDLDRLAHIGDAVVAQFAAMAEKNVGESESFDLLEGSFPQVMRSVNLHFPDTGRGARNDHPPAVEPSLFWSYPTSAGRSKNHGWWVIANSQSLHSRTIETLIRTPHNMEDPAQKIPVSYMLARPADFLQTLIASELIAQESIPPPILALGRIRLVEGHSFFKTGLLHGSIKVLLIHDEPDR